ncbi:MAG: ATP-binding cassette domain-containing protein, partial [Myxococcota bacterium]
MSAEDGSLFEVEFDRTGFRLDFRLEWDASSLVLFGPSGSGKTTLMRVVLGLEPQARSRLKLAGSWLEDADRGLRVPVHERRLGWVPQSPTLFPDRSVLQNIRFGARQQQAEVDIA